MWKSVIVLPLLVWAARAQNYTITTIAGGRPLTGQVATSYAINGPAGISVDAAGNLYLALIDWCQVWVVNSSGVLSQVIGTGACGFAGDNGPASAAHLLYPVGVAADSAGNIYIADLSNHRVRKVSGGIITTFAGTGAAGYNGDNIAASSAQLYYPGGLVVDSADNLYITDSENHRIRKVSAGIITTVAGTGTQGYNGDNLSAGSAQLNYPQSVALDSAGNLYIADTQNNRVRKVSGGIITTIAGTGAGGYNGDNFSATLAQVNFPYGVAVDNSGTIYITDSNNNRIRKVSGGIISTVPGGTPSNVSFPTAAAAGPSGVYVADQGNNRIVRVTSGGVTTVVGNSFISGGDGGIATNAQLALPASSVVDSSGNIFIADSYACVVRKIAAGTGIISTVAGYGTCGTYGDNMSATGVQLWNPFSVAVDGRGNLYVVDYSNRVRKVSNGFITTMAGTLTAGYNGDNINATSAQLNTPRGIAVDDAGILYIADTRNHRIRKVSNGIITTVAGTGTGGYGGDNSPAVSAQIRGPMAVTLDSAGALYIADYDNDRIRKVAGGIITTVAGNGTAGYNGDNLNATSAQLLHPGSVAVDGTGSIFIGDSFNYRVRKVSGGIITTIAGNGTYGFSGDGGPGTSATITFGVGVAVDVGGNVYCTDSENNRIRKLTSNASASSINLTAAPNPSTFGQNVTITATVSPSIATGAATLKDGSTTLGTLTLTNGTATWILSTLAAGAHSLTATYSGDANYIGTTSTPVTQTISQVVTSVTLQGMPNTSTFGQAVTLTATVSPATATGTVTFKNGSITLGSGFLNAGTATLTLSTIVPGVNLLTAVYNGDANYLTSTSPASPLTVNRQSTTATLQSSPNPSAYGQSVTLTATVLPASATGSVTFKDGVTTVGSSSLSNGIATLTISSVVSGPHSLTAVYGGDDNCLNGISAALTHTVGQPSAGVTLFSSSNPSLYGQSVTLTSTVSPSTATGNVTFKDGAAALGIATLNNGTATLTLSTLALGTRSLSAVYGGDGNNPANSSSTFTQTVATAGKAGVFRSGAAFLLDTNGNGGYDPGLDRFIAGFTGTGGFIPGDVPVVGDWTGDGHTKVGIFRASTGEWFLDANNNGIFDAGDSKFGFGGVPGDIPFVGDWKGIGKSCVGVFRSGFFWVLDLNCNGAFDEDGSDAAFPFGGLSGDVPVVGNWGGGATRVGVVRKYAPAGVPQGDPFYWVLDAGAANAGSSPALHQPDIARCFAFGGLPGDVFVTGDWYGAGIAAAGVYRSGLWALDAALPGAPQATHIVGPTFGYGGIAGDIPVTGRW